MLVQANNNQFKVLDTLKAHKIVEYTPIQVVEHVMSAHSHVQYVVTNAPWYYLGSVEATLNLLTAIRQAPCYEINCIFGNTEDAIVDNIINIIKSDRNHVSVSHSDDINRPEIAICSRYSV